MSKATAPCSSCPSSKSTPTAEKSSSVYTPTIECVLEDVLPIDSDATIKVKNFKNFLGYDLKTLNITGELQTTIHKNGFTHTKMIVTYQDKKSKKVSYLEIDILDNTNKKVENTNKKVENTSKEGGCTGTCPSNCSSYQCNVDTDILYCSCPSSTLNAVVSTSITDARPAASRDDADAWRTQQGSQLVVTTTGKKVTVLTPIAG